MREAPPPRWLEALLRRALPSRDRDAMAGDMGELFVARVARDGRGRALWWYARHVLRFVVQQWMGGVAMRWISDVISDVRWALQGMRRRPGFTAMAVATLALGIGSNSAIVTLVSADLMAPLPYERPEELVAIWHEQTEVKGGRSQNGGVAVGTYFAWKEAARSFASVAAFDEGFETTVSWDGGADRVVMGSVTPDFFAVLRARPELGTTSFTEESTREAGRALVVLNHDFWMERFGGDPDVIGRTVRIYDDPYTVAGVMPASFRQPDRDPRHRPQLWRPSLFNARRDEFRIGGGHMIARLAPGVSVEQANAELARINRHLAQAYPDAPGCTGIFCDDQPFTGTVRSLGDPVETHAALILLIGAGATILLLVCANVANLTLARGQERQRDFAVRAALGCGAGRLVRQILAEGMVLAVAGAVVGTGVVLLTRRGLQLVQERYFSAITDVSIDFRVIGLTALLTLAAGVLFALPLARMASRSSLRGSMGDGGGQGGWDRRSNALRNALVMSQVALATMLLAVSALLVRSFDTLVGVSPGFDPHGRVTVDLYPLAADYPESADRERYFREIVRGVEAVPGVSSVALASDLPFTDWNMFSSVTLADQPHDEATATRAEVQGVSPNYFQVMGIPILAGRTFEDAWPAGEDEPLVLSRRLARMLVPGGNVVGRTITMGTTGPNALQTHLVVAVVGDVHDGGYAADTDPIFYIPFGKRDLGFASLVIRTRARTSEVIPGIKEAVHRTDPTTPMKNLRSVDAMLASTVEEPMAASRAGAGAALLALLVAAAGICGVLSYSVQVRTREIGIRAALGADARGIVAAVVGQSALMLAVGLVLGLGGALAIGTALSSFLFGVQSWDPPSLAAATAILGLVGLVAAWVPARRAVRIDVTKALRAE